MATAQNSIPKFGWLDWFDMNQEKTNGIFDFQFLNHTDHFQVSEGILFWISRRRNF